MNTPKARDNSTRGQQSPGLRSARVGTTRETPNIASEQVEILQEIFPHAFAEGRMDFEKLRATLGDTIDNRPDRFAFSWAGKRDAVQIIQMPSRATLVPIKNDSIDFETTGNIFIEGDNLEVLKLLHKTYFGRVKMMYIDPPYNTGKERIYTDNYADPLGTYLKITSQEDEAGNLLTSNPETSGRFHSAWLSMMYPRLFYARQLLSDDGVIFVSIDDHEVQNLKMIMNEIFGDEAFIAQFVWKSRQQKDNRNTTGASVDHEYVLCYGKRVRGSERRTEQYSNPDNDPRGPWSSGNMVGLQPENRRPELHYDLVDPKTGINYGRPPLGWRYDRDTMAQLIAEERIIWPSSPTGRPRRKVFLNELGSQFTGYSSIIGEDLYTRHGTEEIEAIFGSRVLDFPKPSTLIQELVEQGCDENGIVLDFFAGSCSTAQAVLELNRRDRGHRRFIMVQLPEPTPEDSIARKSGYKSIAEIGKERIRRVIARMEKEADAKQADLQGQTEDLGLRVFRLAESNYKIWRGVEERTPEKYIAEMQEHVDSLLKGWKTENVIYEVAIKEGFDLTFKRERETRYKDNEIWRVSDTGNAKSFLICLDDKIMNSTVKGIGISKGEMFVCRDVALDDTSAANLALQCVLKTI